MAACGAATSGGGSATARPSPTPDPEVARVKAAVTAFIQAAAKSEETGVATQVEAMTVPGSHAQGNIGSFASEPLGTGTGFKTTRLDIDASSWTVHVAGGNAVVDVTFGGYGYPVSYPQDGQIGSPRQGTTFHWHIELQKTEDQWLIASYA
jgi:hypothetical protein